MISLYQLSATDVVIEIDDVPVGRTVAKVYLALKYRRDDPDADAIFFGSTTTVTNANPIATATVAVGQSDLAKILPPLTVWYIAKVILDNGSPHTSDSLEGLANLGRFGIQAVS